MPRKRRSTEKKKVSKNRGKRGQILRYSESAMLQALNDVEQGKSVAQAARDNEVPRITLLYKARGKRPVERKMGPDTALSPEEETRIVDWVFKSSRNGFPVTKNNLFDSVKRLLDESNRTSIFTDNRPGKSWFNSFLKRHPGVTQRVAQNLTASRANVTPADLIEWSNQILRYLSENDQADILYDPSRLFNGDESAFFLNPKGPTVLAPKGDKTVYQTVNPDEKECITVLVTANAEGQLAPPLVVFKYERIPFEIAKSVPENWGIGKSESGWMNGALFFEYITNVFFPWLCSNSIQLPVIFFLDGHVSHLTLQTSTFCSENGIILIALYPNATHLIQPMDVAVFRSLKGAWREKVHDWRVKNMKNPILKKKDFTPLLKEVLDSINPTIITNGFRKCGLYPWNANAPFNSPASKEVAVEVTNPVIRSTSKASKCLQFMEQIMGSEKLRAFISSVDDPVASSPLRQEDISLFNLWRDLREQAQAPFKTPSGKPIGLMSEVGTDSGECDTPEQAQGREPPAPPSEESTSIPGSRGSPLLELTHGNTTTSEEPQPTSQTEGIPVQPPGDLPDPRADDALPLPSPFKRAFIFHEPGTSLQAKKIRKRELFPSVITSKPWREYHEKKATQKIYAEMKKKERAVERERKKTEKEAQQLMKKEERERKKKGKAIPRKKNEPICNRQRKPPIYKKKLPSSESEEWEPSMDEDDTEEEEYEQQGVFEEDLARPLILSSNGMDTEAEKVVFNATEMNAESEVDAIISQIFSVKGLDIEPQDYETLGNDQLEGGEDPMFQPEELDPKSPQVTDVAKMAFGNACKEEKTPQIVEVVFVANTGDEARRNEENMLEENQEGQQIGQQAIVQDAEKDYREGRSKETEKGEQKTDFLEEGCYVVVRFKKNKGQTEHVCRITTTTSDDELFVMIMCPSSRIGSVFEEHSWDVRKVNVEQIVRKLPTPAPFGSKIQFPPGSI